ncbi:hypothetical protein M501DRAFT_984997 [Patellaria atrata CBS 101060]|uniref:T6SS Phospholipase effector Tle1-like catalytic domain-containing protein n=1 Tax=Patellaria atrata CBS 101060 TaxID=1346257 RepID=A0A9P4SI88_9PEZI|nr:hypothetical protein M501DRAFT_984997 [Patellaria atrata CBS 101060]
MANNQSEKLPTTSNRHAPSNGANNEHYDPAKRVGKRERKKFILCFDGTGNRFTGTDTDSNILKIYRMMDRADGSQFHYYQPGIGTYVTTTSFTHTSTVSKIKSWYAKAKDSAVGSSFAEHVMGGYKFLMRYYTPGDDIFFFGFSRGAYTARFLAEMLDHVGLLSPGNEEMARFAWKTFQTWQIREDKTEEDKKEKRQLLEFMCAFRETFSRPVRRIRFLGLFDTVNSVPRFENAWMQRSRFPYTARSSAKVIRHAVAIDERRAKFRQDLISEVRCKKKHHRRRSYWHATSSAITAGQGDDDIPRGGPVTEDHRYKKPARNDLRPTLLEKFRDPSEVSGVRSLSPNYRRASFQSGHESHLTSISQTSVLEIKHYEDSDSGEEREQDILEVWFPGCHADIGGGLPLHDGEDAALSHVPLVWMVQEAQRAGLRFDETKLQRLNCCLDFEMTSEGPPGAPIPQIEIDPASPDPESGAPRLIQHPNPSSLHHDVTSEFNRILHAAATRGKIHDVLQFNNGLPRLSVISWNIMEYLPFRRMDLQEDGSWKSITWPLPKGEVRDIPDEVIVHNSVLRRMEADPTYRPGNLICGGGGRGVRRAPPEFGIGEWVRWERSNIDPISEVYIRAKPTLKK